jgi:hypothetical protein
VEAINLAGGQNSYWKPKTPSRSQQLGILVMNAWFESVISSGIFYLDIQISFRHIQFISKIVLGLPVKI